MEENRIRRFGDLGRVQIPKDIREKIFGKADVFYKAVTVSVTDNGEIVLTPYSEGKKK